MSKAPIERTASYWGTQDRRGKKLFWWEVPAVPSRMNAKVSGDPQIDWLIYTVNTYLANRLPLERCPSLGCGEGWLERRLAGLGVFTACDAYDVAPGAVDRARRLAADKGYQNIHYAVVDVNHLDLTAQAYDVVWINGAMHHFERLEHVCAQIQQGLKPDGLLVLNEYVGPSRFQFPVRQREVIRAVFTLLPRRYRMLVDARGEEISTRSPMRRGLRWTVGRLQDKLLDGDLVTTLHRRWQNWKAARSGEGILALMPTLPTARDVAAADPSEAVRSAEIMDVVSRFFTIVERRDTGGALLQFLLDGIAGNFCHNDAETRGWLNLVFQIEDALLACGDLPSDFAYVIARPKVERGI